MNRGVSRWKDGEARREEPRSLSQVARNGHTLADWARIYQRNPKAVPPAVQQVLEQRQIVTPRR